MRNENKQNKINKRKEKKKVGFWVVGCGLLKTKGIGF